MMPTIRLLLALALPLLPGLRPGSGDGVRPETGARGPEVAAGGRTAHTEAVGAGGAFSGWEARRSGGGGEPDSAAAPVPVLLVPGWSDRPETLRPLRDRLVRVGWPRDRVAMVAFEDPVGSNVVHAAEVGRALDALLETTGAPEADIVAHSMGGLAVRRHLAGRGSAARVRRVVFLGTPHRGTWAAHLAWGAGGEEMEPGSPFLEELGRAPPVPPGVEAATVRTPFDLRVLPPESATLPGAADYEVCCPSHPGLVENPRVFEVVRRVLAAGPGGGTPAGRADDGGDDGRGIGR